jgi:hypothetical protein
LNASEKSKYWQHQRPLFYRFCPSLSFAPLLTSACIFFLFSFHILVFTLHWLRWCSLACESAWVSNHFKQREYKTKVIERMGGENHHDVLPLRDTNFWYQKEDYSFEWKYLMSWVHFLVILINIINWLTTHMSDIASLSAWELNTHTNGNAMVCI